MMSSLKLRILLHRLRRKLLGHKIEIRRSWQETPAQFQDMVQFLNWFDATSSIEACVEKAQSDWKLRFRTTSGFEDLEHRKALEIGFGGGRLLAQAAQDFEFVYGVDIHDAFAMTDKFLRSQGHSNFALLERDEITTIEDETIDFVYSFIVFQHFDSADEVEYYLDHICRVLKPYGVAHIYYGRCSGDGHRVTSDEEFDLRDCSLFFAPTEMHDRLEPRFEIVDFANSLPRDPVSGEGVSAQARVVLRKRRTNPQDHV
jgi:SAM-dependent methyltransferase